MSILLDKDMLGATSPRLPIEGLPYKVQDIITTYAKAMNCPTEFVTGAAMAAAARDAFKSTNSTTIVEKMRMKIRNFLALRLRCIR